MTDEFADPDAHRIAFIGTYVPRRCGIATFTHDLCTAVARAFPSASCLALPINDRAEGYEYSEPVRFEIRQHELESYRRAADFLNINNVELVCLQHEFGIFGGPAGAHVLALLRELRMPVVTTLHTVLREPDEDQRRVMKQLAELSDRLVVMAEKGGGFLREVYGIPEEKIEIIPHGIPDVPFVDPNFYKADFGMEEKQVLLTFGLLSPNKGIEQVIDALPLVLQRHPDVVYLVLGATHPHLLEHEGESYRLSLQRRAEANGVKKQVIFFNQFVSTEQLTEFLGAADIYITPYLNEAQITSGTLAYAFGMGKAVISTPYWHAQELLAEDHGLLVPFDDSEKMAEAILEYLDDQPRRHATRKRAYLAGRKMIWPEVARRYGECFRHARNAHHYHGRPRLPLAEKTVEDLPYELPPLKLDHLHRLTDDTGLLEHAAHIVPKYGEGYSLDDNARALLLTLLLGEAGEADASELRKLSTRYLAFVREALDWDTGLFHNDMTYARQWMDEPGPSEDAHGRTLWALGAALGRRNVHPGFRGLAGELFERALPAVESFRSPRALASSLLGIHEYLRKFSGDRTANGVRETLARRLLEYSEQTAAPDWPWFEDIVAYENAIIPHALILSGHWIGDGEMRDTGLTALAWLAELQTSAAGRFSPIGSDGFYPRGGERAHYDQQPLEAQAMVFAALEAHRTTREERWLHRARDAFEWFLGRNDLDTPLYDSSTGGCRDGLHLDRVNQNQGAESTLAFHLSLAEMRLAADALPPTQQ